MAPCLEDCSPEILGIVLAQLNRQDAGALRQCSRWLTSICMENSHFKSLFDSKRVKVTERGLEDLAKFTKPGRIGVLLQKLTLIGLATNVWSARRPPRLIKCRKHSTEDERKLLSEAFRTIATHSHSGKLASLTLKVDLIEDGERVSDCEIWRYDFKFRWYAAARVFDLAWRALAMSALQVEGLNIFSDYEMRSGALSCELLTELDWEDPGLLKSFASIQSISMSLSTRLIEEYEPEEDENEVGEHGTDRRGRDRRESPKRREVDDLRAEVADEKNFIGLGKLLRHCQQLSDVDIHYATLRYHPREFSELVQTRLLQRTVEVNQLPILERCRLSGLYVRADDLLTFIERIQPCDLSLEHISLLSGTGTFRPIFDYCQSEDTRVRSVFFDWLREYRLVFFHAPGRPKHSFSLRPRGNPTLKRTGAAAKNPIVYKTPDAGRPVGTPDRDYWRQYWRRVYGPMGSGITLE